MNGKEVPKISKDQDSTNPDWKFCPICGNQLPNIQNLKFCTVCGTDIKYIKDYKKLRPTSPSNPYTPSTTHSHYKSPQIFYGLELITDENLIDNKNHKLWGTTASIGLPLAALLVMQGVVGGFLTLIMVLSNDLSIILNLD